MRGSWRCLPLPNQCHPPGSRCLPHMLRLARVNQENEGQGQSSPESMAVNRRPKTPMLFLGGAQSHPVGVLTTKSR